MHVAYPCSNETFLSVPSAAISETVSLREKLVDEIIKRVKSLHIIMVRGTPASGKTTLMQLVGNRLLETLGHEHATHTLTGWPERKVEGAGDWKGYSRKPALTATTGAVIQPTCYSTKHKNLTGTASSGQPSSNPSDRATRKPRLSCFLHRMARRAGVMQALIKKCI